MRPDRFLKTHKTTNKGTPKVSLKNSKVLTYVQRKWWQTHNETLKLFAETRSGRGVEAYDLYLKMKEEGFQPNAVTSMSLPNDYAST